VGFAGLREASHFAIEGVSVADQLDVQVPQESL
jgi:hypothetical protein